MSDYSGLTEILDAKTSEFTVWTDLSRSGMLFTRPHFGNAPDFRCFRAGFGKIADFQIRTDLPISARIIASDAGYSEWYWNGSVWGQASSPASSITTVTHSRDIEATDNGCILVVTGANITLTLKTSKLFGNFSCIGYSTDTNKTTFAPATGVLHNGNGDTSSSGTPYKQWAITLAPDGFVLDGSTST